MKTVEVVTFTSSVSYITKDFQQVLSWNGEAFFVLNYLTF